MYEFLILMAPFSGLIPIAVWDGYKTWREGAETAKLRAERDSIRIVRGGRRAQTHRR